MLQKAYIHTNHKEIIMEFLASIGIFFAGLGLFFLGIGVLWWCTMYKRIKTRRPATRDDNFSYDDLE